MRSLEGDGIETKGKKILIVGTGGAARAVGYYLAEQAKELLLFDVIGDKSEALTSELKKRGNVTRVESLGGLYDMDIIINATPLGLKDADPLPIDLSAVDKRQVIGDLIYKETRLQRETASKGCKTFNGLGMLIWQGALAFELWTGKAAPYETMRSAIENR